LADETKLTTGDLARLADETRDETKFIGDLARLALLLFKMPRAVRESLIGQLAVSAQSPQQPATVKLFREIKSRTEWLS
jgi:hypothetical protein